MARETGHDRRLGWACRRFLVGTLLAASAACGGGDGPTGLSTSGFTIAPHGRFPTLPNLGGRVLSPMRLVVIVPANNTLRDSLFLFADALTSSSWWRTVSAPYGVTALPGSLKATGDSLQGVDLTSQQLQSYIQSVIASTAALAPDGRTMYLLYLPAGVTFANNKNCGISGYHAGLLSGKGDGWGVVMPCQSIFHSVFEQLTIIGSHEIIEAATDPVGNTWTFGTATFPWTVTPWTFADGFGEEENADICESTRYAEGGFYYQRIFSNAAAAAEGDPCVPKFDVPYYNATTSVNWYLAKGGVTIPVTGWSTAPGSDWGVTVSIVESGPVVPKLTLSDPDTMVINGRVFAALNNGGLLNVQVSFPDGGLPGDWAVLSIYSSRFDASGQRGPAGDDYGHLWMVGAYVPTGASVVANVAPPRSALLAPPRVGSRLPFASDLRDHRK